MFEVSPEILQCVVDFGAWPGYQGPESRHVWTLLDIDTSVSCRNLLLRSIWNQVRSNLPRKSVVIPSKNNSISRIIKLLTQLSSMYQIFQNQTNQNLEKKTICRLASPTGNSAWFFTHPETVVSSVQLPRPCISSLKESKSLITVQGSCNWISWVAFFFGWHWWTPTYRLNEKVILMDRLWTKNSHSHSHSDHH